MSENITLQGQLMFSLGAGDSKAHACLSKMMHSHRDQGDLGKQK